MISSFPSQLPDSETQVSRPVSQSEQYGLDLQDEALQRAIDRFWETVPLVWNRIKTNVSVIATSQFGITIEQFHVMRHIFRGITSASELAKVKQTSRSAISQTVDTLVEKGLISRQYNSHDRRHIKLELTEKGAALLNAIFRQNRAWMKEQMSALSGTDLNTLIAAMDILKETFYPKNS